MAGPAGNRGPDRWQLGLVNYTADEQIAISYPLYVITGNPFYYSQDRDSRSYIGYVVFNTPFCRICL